ncbi:LysR family transcriptional regulator [Streptomyces sp. NPDC090075]|uniref:LysR family transcriptional regulator n=1 Tax=Streptomyces sp. NPDC090075 TaxID=3365937 RepID=UPI003830C921
MDPGHVRLPALIEEFGSLSVAAHGRQPTPGVVTRQMARAECEWQVPLVVREPPGAGPTEAGAVLAKHGRVVEEAAWPWYRSRH